LFVDLPTRLTALQSLQFTAGFSYIDVKPLYCFIIMYIGVHILVFTTACYYVTRMTAQPRRRGTSTLTSSNNEQRLCLQIPRVVLGGAFKAKLRHLQRIDRVRKRRCVHQRPSRTV
jgi:hypothetical protein